MAVTVRRAEEKDAPEVAAYALRLFAQHHDYDARRFMPIGDAAQAARYYASQTHADDAAVLVAELDGKVVGFAFLQYEARNYAELLENAVWLHDIFLDEAARSTGAGRKLIEASIVAAKEMGADKLMLSVAAKNEHAREFFARQGFRPTMIEMTMNLDGREG